jgi:hypothetical protein
LLVSGFLTAFSLFVDSPIFESTLGGSFQVEIEDQGFLDAEVEVDVLLASEF